ncbi:hypothetical protein [Candidatus Methanoplasma termitum]|uniref:hypothetical protein n=1 Tax=Candidatus Methanoplasma termitum TaxID=1577791 RepID=UPI0011DDC9B5|nr:hypothetical protein [Candidatus Methanoplasma termitum]MCL2333561.1 hypothetical protein [Candidatus Methanoplasma sp.]
MRNTQPPIIGRIDSFLSRSDAKTLRGDRRMGTGALLDMIADRISIDDSVNIIRVTEEHEKNSLNYIHSMITMKKNNFILLYVDIDAANIIAAFPDAKVLKAKEICHQVPVCFKEPVLNSFGGLSCSAFVDENLSD